MLILICLLILFFVTMFYVATKEGLADNTKLDKQPIHVDLEKNSVEIPNLLTGIVSDDLDIGGNLNILNENKLKFGKMENDPNSSKSGTIQYKNDLLNIYGSGKDKENHKTKIWDDLEIGSLLEVGSELSVKGPIKLGANKENQAKIEYEGMLEITGAGESRKIKLSDGVEIGGMLKTINQTGTDQTITGSQSVNNQTVTGTQTINNKQMLLGGQEVSGVSNYNGKVNINPTENDRRNMVDLSIGNEHTGFRKGDKKIIFTGDTNEIGGFDSNSMFINNTKPLEFGKGIVKQQDAGKIGYQRFSADSLDIVGAGLDGQARKVKLWDDVLVNGGLTVNGPVSMPQLKQSEKFSIGNEIEFAKGSQKEQNAGKIVYKGHGSRQSLDIIGASPGNTTSWNRDRKIQLWDNVDVINDLNVERNLNVKGTITLGKGNNKWVISAREGGSWIEFLHQNTNQDNYNDNVGHIIMSGDGNIWLPRSTRKGWVADNIGNVASQAASADASSKDFSNKVRTGRSRSGPGYKGRITFDRPFPNNIDPRKIRVTATFNIWGPEHGNRKYILEVHIVYNSVDRNGFNYYCTGTHSNEREGNWNVWQGWFTPGEPFEYIAIAT